MSHRADSPHAAPFLLVALATMISPLPLHGQGGQRGPRADSTRQAQQLDTQGNHAAARAIFQRLIETAPDPAAKAAAQRRMALSWGFEGNCTKAVEYEELVIGYWVTQEASTPQDAFYQQGEMANEAARVCIDAGDLSTAERMYRRGSELGLREPEPKTHPKSLWDYRLAHAMARLSARRGNAAEAGRQLAEARRILASDSTMAAQQARFLPYLAGYVALYTGDLKTAEAELIRATELNAGDPFMHALLGMTYEKAGQSDKAMAQYRKSYDMATSHSPPAAFSRPFARRKLEQRPVLSPGVRQYVSVDSSVVALTNVRVIDGTGAPARENQTLIIRDGIIAELGSSATLQVPAGALVLDLTGKSVIPGLVMMHEHLYYPTGPGVYGNLAESFSRLYLAGGVTSMRTGGNMNGFGELAIARAIQRGEKPGPWIDATAPYLEGPGLPLGQVYVLKDAADARRLVNYWADAGATSFKAYMHITREQLGAAVDEAHKRGLKVTGHLCSVTYREAAALGIDNLEHGFFASTDFVAGKKPDECPGQGGGQAALAALDPAGPEVGSLIDELVRRNVALTSTLTVFETFTPGQPLPPGLDVLDPALKQQFEERHAATQRSSRSIYAKLFGSDRAMELRFFRAGGLLLAGTDPTGGGGVIPGYSNQRQVELLVEGGFTPLEAIRICTLNGATYLGRAATVGSIARGKQADLVVIGGDPSARISDIRNVEIVFRQGVGYDPARLIASVKGKVGLY